MMNTKYPTNRDLINELLIVAAKENNLAEFKYLLFNDKLLYEPDNLEEAFKTACAYGSFDIIDYYLYSEEMKDKISLKRSIQDGFFSTCINGRLDVLEFLFTKEECKSVIDVTLNDNEAFKTACEYANLDIIKYLLTSPNINKEVDVHAEFDAAFRRACVNGNLDVINYLLSSPELKTKVDIHTDDDSGFISAIEHIHVIEYFIFEKNIEKTKTIDKFLTLNHFDNIQKMFEIRDFNQKLNHSLSDESSKTKRIKM